MPDVLSAAAQILGSRVREARYALGLSQDEVSNLASMASSNYGKIERGLSNPTFHTIVRIATVLNVDPAVLVRGIAADKLPENPPSYSAVDYIREKRARS